MKEGNPLFNQLAVLCNDPFGTDRETVRRGLGVSLNLKRGFLKPPHGEKFDGAVLVMDIAPNYAQYALSILLIPVDIDPFVDPYSWSYDEGERPIPLTEKIAYIPLSHTHRLSLTPVLVPKPSKWLSVFKK